MDSCFRGGVFSTITDGFIGLIVLAQVIKGIEAGLVPVTPDEPQGIISHGVDRVEFDIHGDIPGFDQALAGHLVPALRTGAKKSQAVEGVVRDMTVMPFYFQPVFGDPVDFQRTDGFQDHDDGMIPQPIATGHLFGTVPVFFVVAIMKRVVRKTPLPGDIASYGASGKSRSSRAVPCVFRSHGYGRDA